MKKQFLALSLIAMPGLFAQGGENNMSQMSQQSGYCGTCCCSPCCCKPCCIPKPKKCIDCECYTPQYYDLQCDCGIFASVDFLYWYARETNLSYALKVTGTPMNANAPDVLVFAPTNYQNLNTQWDPGFRLGLGWNSECDGWDLYLTWTYMHNKKKNSTSVPDYSFGGLTNVPGLDQAALLNPWINMSFQPPSIGGNAGITTFDKVSAKWKLNFNSIDLELGRKYWLSPCFTLRPYAGLRGAWTKTQFRTTSSRTITNSSSVENTGLFKDQFTNRYWGVGFLAGLQPNWYFCNCFVLYANVDAALIWGKFEAKKREVYNDLAGVLLTSVLPVNYTNNSNHDFFQMTGILDLAIGLRWEDTWCCDRYRTNLDIGWEHHIWFDHNHRMKTYDFFQGDPQTPLNGFRTYDETTGNLMLGGLVIRLRFDF